MGVRTDFNGTITLSNRLSKDCEKRLIEEAYPVDYFYEYYGSIYELNQERPELHINAEGKYIEDFAGFLNVVKETVKGEATIKDCEVYYDVSDGSFGMLRLQDDGLYDYEGVRAYSDIGVKVDF